MLRGDSVGMKLSRDVLKSIERGQRDGSVVITGGPPVKEKGGKEPLVAGEFIDSIFPKWIIPVAAPSLGTGTASAFWKRSARRRCRTKMACRLATAFSPSSGVRAEARGDRGRRVAGALGLAASRQDRSSRRSKVGCDGKSPHVAKGRGGCHLPCDGHRRRKSAVAM